jgi:RNA 2',3'-cyclic 3'-phosphodiesterase
MDSKRLFLAFPIDDHFDELIKKFIAQQNIPNIKWIVPENWHITVLFLGDFPAHHIPVLISSLNEFFKTRQFFSLDFERFIYKPNQSRPTMIWAKFYQNTYFDLLCLKLADHLEKLYSELSVPFRMSIHSENIPHITLSRLKNQLNRYPDLNLKRIDNIQPLLRCDFCTLFQSVLLSEGAKYSNLADFKLNQN